MDVDGDGKVTLEEFTNFWEGDRISLLSGETAQYQAKDPAFYYAANVTTTTINSFYTDAQIEVVAPKSRQDFAPRTESARLDLQTQTQSLEENLPSTTAPATGPVVEAERPMQ